jgi:hypothetical protein
MTDEQLRELVRACAQEIAWRKEQERRAQARAERQGGLQQSSFQNDLLALARRAGLSEEELRVLSG